MLIINADDLGRNPLATNNIISSFEAGVISSASAMVFMADSERAAQLAISSGLDVGLHVNYSEQFSSNSINEQVGAGQKKICKFLLSSKYASILYNPFLTKHFNESFSAQYKEFIRLYGREPSHFDGHQHMHLASNVLFQQILPFGSKVRRSFSFLNAEKSIINRYYRRLVDRHLMARHRTTDYFFSLAGFKHHVDLTRVIELSKVANIELMTHPEHPSEYNQITDQQFRDSLQNVTLAPYSSL